MILNPDSVRLAGELIFAAMLFVGLVLWADKIESKKAARARDRAKRLTHKRDDDDKHV